MKKTIILLSLSLAILGNAKPLNEVETPQKKLTVTQQVDKIRMENQIYYRTIVKNIPILVNIERGSIIYLTDKEAKNTRHGAFYNYKLEYIDEVVEYDMNFIVTMVTKVGKNIQEI